MADNIPMLGLTEVLNEAFGRKGCTVKGGLITDYEGVFSSLITLNDTEITAMTAEGNDMAALYGQILPAGIVLPVQFTKISLASGLVALYGGIK